jgi:hypothetical protein
MKPYPSSYAPLRRRLRSEVEDFLQMYAKCAKEDKPLPSVQEFLYRTSLDAGVTPRTVESIFKLFRIEVQGERLVQAVRV